MTYLVIRLDKDNGETLYETASEEKAKKLLALLETYSWVGQYEILICEGGNSGKIDGPPEPDFKPFLSEKILEYIEYPAGYRRYD